MAEKTKQTKRTPKRASTGSAGASRSGGQRLRHKQAEAYRAKKVQYWTGIGILFGLVLLLNVLSRLSHGFCDWYSRYVFPVWLNTYGRLTSLLPFSLGEWLIIAALILVTVILILWIPALILKRKDTGLKFRYYTKRFYRFALVVFLDVALIMTLNCFILYNRTPLDPNPKAEKREYSVDDLYKLREFLAKNVNELVVALPRDAEGKLAYDGSLQKSAVKAMHGIADDYPMLDGWIPKVKSMRIFANVLSQSYICGYYLPFSMEANVNPIMYLTNFPECYCHELAHVRGYILEDEANFISYLACIESEDPMFRYSGYLSVFWYVEEDLQEALAANPALSYSFTALNESVYEDDVFLTEETWNEVEESAVISTETVDKISDKVTDTELKLSGVASGIESYSEVVRLLLRYYDGKLY